VASVTTAAAAAAAAVTIDDEVAVGRRDAVSPRRHARVPVH